ncbi:MAG: translation initiation factor IF-5A [Candidatus Marsarchaeota archaeon]|nr:translation initiation factor IF-5A [Candidatus Marsarchaeota archaeon]
MAEDVSYNLKSAKEIGKGSFVIIDGIPCKIVDIETSAPGKHGAAKSRITAIGIFDGSKKTLLVSGHGEVQVPEILKKRAQVVSVTENMAQLMDLENYDIFESVVPEEMKGSLKSGAEVEVLETMGKRAITRVVGGG